MGITSAKIYLTCLLVIRTFCAGNLKSECVDGCTCDYSSRDGTKVTCSGRNITEVPNNLPSNTTKIRGLGLAYVKHFVEQERPPAHVFATCRSPETAKELLELASSNTSITVVKLDVTDLASVESARVEVEAKLGKDGLNLLINNAAIDVTQGFYDVTEKEMIDHFRTNCIGPLLVTRSFLSLLKRAASSDVGSQMSCSRAAVVNISSDWASIGANDFCGEIPYKVSKAGLNMLSANLTLELKPAGIMVVSIDPGNAMTDMGGPHACVTIDDSVSGVLNTLSKLHGENDTGKFLNYKGESMVW